MATVDQATLEDLLLRDMDGLLTSEDRQLLEKHLEQSPEWAAEQREFHALSSALEDARISVRPDFREQVMAGLPAAPWEAPARSSWRLPLAVLGVLAVATAVLSRLGAKSSATDSLFGSVAAVFDMIKMALVTGAGLLGASWAGLRAAARELFVASPAALAGVVILLVGLNALFWIGIRRRPVSERVQDSHGAGDSSSEG